MKFKRILISTLLIASVTSSTGCSSDFFAKKTNNPQAGAKQQVYAPELDPGVHELITDQRFKSLESDEPLRFETAVTPEEAENGTAVELRDNNGKTISKMYDDGSHSDRIAGDGIYTCSYKPKPNGEETFSYTANIGGEETKPASVRYFDKITKQDIEDMQGISQKASDIESKYLDSEGYVPEDKKEDVLDEIGNYAEELKQSGEAVEYRVNKQYDNVIIKLSSGITMVYDNPSPDTEAGGSSSSNSYSEDEESDDVSFDVHPLTIKGYRPFATDTPSSGSNLSTTMNVIKDEFGDNISVEKIHKDSDANPHSIETFGPDQVIFWRGHAGYDAILHSYLATGQEFDASLYDDDDIIQDRLLVAFKGDNKMRITSEYIDAHCPDMTNSLIFIGACSTARDSVLAASFMNKNCNAVLGFSNTVTTTYDNNMMESLIRSMCEKRSSASTGKAVNYYPVGQALLEARAKHGEYDDEDTPAKLILFGNRSYRFADAIRNDLDPALSDAEEQGRGSFTLEKTHYSIKVGETVKVNTLSRPLGAGKLEWRIDNDNVASIDSDGNITGKSSAVLDRDGNVVSETGATTTGHVVTEDGKYRQDFSITVNP